METEYALLDTHPLDEQLAFSHRASTPKIIHMNDPADTALIDFTTVTAQTIPPQEKVKQALLIMQYAHLKFLLVVDNDDKLVGLISAKDVQGVEPSMMAQKHNINLLDVTVEMVMTPHEKLYAIDYKSLSNARVGHIARIIHEKGVEHLIVTLAEPETNTPCVRGIFAASIISQHLGETVSGDLSSDIVADIQKRTT